MRPKPRTLLALFLMATLLSAWISPAVTSGWTRAAPNPPPPISYRAAIDLLLFNENEEIYLPIISR